MVKSKSMEVMKAVQEDLGEVKTTLSTYAAPVKGAGGVIKNSIQVVLFLRWWWILLWSLIEFALILSCLQELDEVTDEMAEAAINGVAKGASSLWNMASGWLANFKYDFFLNIVKRWPSTTYLF